MGVPVAVLKRSMSEAEFREHDGDEWDDDEKMIHLLHVVAAVGNVLCGLMPGGSPFTGEEIAPWQPLREAGGLDGIERAKAGTFFGDAKHTLGPMGDPETRWAD